MPDTLRDRLQTSLGAAYTLERELGGGGMSRVFVAEEAALGRRIVVKVLAPELAEGLSAERFAREVRLAAQLQHPNVVPVLTAGVDGGGLPYYTMPYIDGASLRERFVDGPLALGEALTILRDLARALRYAHTQGIVHRDIKPENVLLTGGAAVVVDFGVAKAVSAAVGSGATLTQVGMAVGTPAYMAPEQALGQEDVDHRADLYAWGLIAWEALAGRHPFGRQTSPLALIGAHLTQVPEPLAAVCHEVPPGLAALVAQCLAKTPQERPADAQAILDALDTAARAPAAGAVPVASALVGEERPAVAVLPFTNLSSDPENEYLSDGITDEIIGTLGRVRAVRVAGRASCFALKGQAFEPRAVGERLNVTAVVEGSVRRAGNRVRVQAELVNVADGFQLWGERYDRDLTDIFAMQDEIAHAIATALADRLLTPASGVRSHDARPRPEVDAEAYRLYLQAVHVLRNQFTPEAFDRVLALVDRAIAADPQLARAHTARAVVYNNLAVYSIRPPHEVCGRARDAARTALALDPALAEAWSIDAQIAYSYDWDWAAAERSFERALAADPDDAGALARAALFYAVAGRAAEAGECARRVVAVDPLSAWGRFVAGTAYRLLRRFPESVAVCREALDLNPHHALALTTLGGSLLHQGEFEGALEAYERAHALSASNPVATVGLCITHAARGDTTRAETVLAVMVARHEGECPCATWIACACGWLGRSDEAFEWLEHAADAREFFVPWLRVEPFADPLRGDARFAALLQRIGGPGR